MRVVVFSSADKSRSEVNDVIRMFENGLECFHLRKPKFRRKELEKYIAADDDLANDKDFNLFLQKMKDTGRFKF